MNLFQFYKNLNDVNLNMHLTFLVFYFILSLLMNYIPKLLDLLLAIIRIYFLNFLSYHIKMILNFILFFINFHEIFLTELKNLMIYFILSKLNQFHILKFFLNFDFDHLHLALNVIQKYLFHFQNWLILVSFNQKYFI